MLRRRVAISLALATAVSASFPGVAQAGTKGLVVESGETVTLTQTTRLRSLTIEEGGSLVAPDGSAVTLTVNGVETGQKQVTTEGVTTALQPGTYRGDVVLSITGATSVDWSGTTFPLRQALRVTADGVETGTSVLDAIRGGRVTATSATGISLASTGEGFNGVWVAGGEYALYGPTVRFTGNGRYDFVGAGAGVVATGADSRLVVDGAKIDNTGAVRTGIEATDGANLIVKNSRIATHDGTLPADFEPTLMPGQMRSAPWMLGIVGNVRATNLVGKNTTATYIGSDVYSTGWGVLSTDSTDNGQLTAINTRITTGTEGYGSYADGSTVVDRFLGTTFDVDDYGVISTGGTIVLDDSDAATVKGLDTDLDLRLSTKERRAIRDQATTVNSGRFGIMWHGGGSVRPGGTVAIGGHTQVTTGKTTFVDKGLSLALTVDGSEGARLKTGNGVLFQLMDSDDPGPVMVNGKLVNQGVWTEPTGTPEKVTSFDVTAAHSDDAVVNLKNLAVSGDFYNGLRAAKNLVLNLDGATVTGAVSSSTTRHAISTITAADYRQISEVTNTATATVNNGVVLSLAGKSVWKATGTSYLTSLTIGAKASVTAAHGTLTATVNGVATTLRPGTTYTGTIVVTAS
ncbi:hypothetical protein [Actinoplanes sp. NPDC051851]|uniref:hypothetical protein n=1 Tax=Actinoplanes sp. NPDC051851 TaxID=3154753 RepID=UPI00344AECAF